MDAELVALRERIERLERETGSLKRQRWLVLGVFAGALLVFGSPLGRTEDAAQNLVCRSLKVVDQEGNPRVSLDIQATGGRVLVAGNDARPRAVVGVDHDAGFTDWYGADGKPRAMLFTSEDGNAELHLAGADAQLKALLGSGKSGGFFGSAGMTATPASVAVWTTAPVTWTGSVRTPSCALPSTPPPPATAR